MYGLCGKMVAQPGQRTALAGHLLHAAQMLRDLEGCLLYTIHEDPADADGLWVYEAWRSQADHQASLAHPAIQGLIAVARPLIAGMPQRIELTPLGGKGLPNAD